MLGCSALERRIDVRGSRQCQPDVRVPDGIELDRPPDFERGLFLGDRTSGEQGRREKKGGDGNGPSPQRSARSEARHVDTLGS